MFNRDIKHRLEMVIASDSYEKAINKTAISDLYDRVIRIETLIKSMGYKIQTHPVMTEWVKVDQK